MAAVVGFVVLIGGWVGGWVGGWLYRAGRSSNSREGARCRAGGGVQGQPKVVRLVFKLDSILSRPERWYE